MSVTRGFDRTITNRPLIAGIDKNPDLAADLGMVGIRATPEVMRGERNALADAIANQITVEAPSIRDFYNDGSDLYKTNFRDPVIRILDGVDETPDTVSTGGGGRSLAALADFVGRGITGVDSRYGGLASQLETNRALAAARIAEASQAARDRVGGRDPLATCNYSVAVGDMPMAAGTEYLRRSGASTGDVDAARELGRQLLEAQVGSGQRFADAVAASQEADRLSRLAAIDSSETQGVSALEANALARLAEINNAREAERRALEQTLLQAQLRYG